MNITDKDDGVLIDFGNKLNGKIKILFFFGSLLALSLAIGFAANIYNELKYQGPDIIVYGNFALLLIEYLVGWRYSRRILKKESLFITKDNVRIINSILNKKKEARYSIDKITDFNYNGKAPKTDHPLKGKSYDYLGFETNELVIADVNDEGNLSFKYTDTTVAFGRNVYSWDAEKINEVLLRITDGKLQIGNLPKETNEDEPTLQDLQGGVA